MLNNRQLDRVLAVFAFVTFCGLIHPFHIHPLRNYYHDALCIVALLAGIGLFCSVKKIELRIPSAVVLPLGLIVVIALQTWNGFILLPMDSFYPIVDLLCFALAMIFGATLALHSNGTEKLCISFAYLFVAVGLVSVVFQHIQLIGVDAMPFVMPAYERSALRPYGNFGQPNILALMLCFSMASVWWLYGSRRLSAWLALVLVVVFMWGLTLTQSRIGWIILPLFCLACWIQPPNCASVSKKVLVGLLILFAAMVVCAPHILTALGVSVEAMAQRAGHASVRIVLWQQAWTMSCMHPWFGVGWLQFGSNQVALASLFKPTELADYAHNIVLNFAAELGWPITLIIFGSTAYWFRLSCAKAWNNPQVRYLSLILIAVAAHSMVEFPLWNAYVLVPFGVMVGALHGDGLGARQVSLARAWLILFLVGALSAVGFVSWDYHRVVQGFQALYWQQTGDARGEGGTEKPAFTLFPQFFDYMRIDKIKLYTGMPKSDITFLENMALSFGFPPVLERLALAYAFNHRPAEAVQVMVSEQRLHELYYPKSYALWATYAKQDPALFAQVFNHLPKPEVVNQSQARPAAHH